MSKKQQQTMEQGPVGQLTKIKPGELKAMIDAPPRHQRKSWDAENTGHTLLLKDGDPEELNFD